jgi:hypothetical protein
VIGGPGAFVMVAESFNSLGQAILNKLIAEIVHRGTDFTPLLTLNIPPIDRHRSAAKS